MPLERIFLPDSYLFKVNTTIIFWVLDFQRSSFPCGKPPTTLLQKSQDSSHFWIQRWHQNKALKCKLPTSSSRPLKLIFHGCCRDKTPHIWKEKLPERTLTKSPSVAASSSFISDFQQILYQPLILTHTKEAHVGMLQQKQLIVPFKKHHLKGRQKRAKVRQAQSWNYHALKERNLKERKISLLQSCQL